MKIVVINSSPKISTKAESYLCQNVGDKSWYTYNGKLVELFKLKSKKNSFEEKKCKTFVTNLIYYFVEKFLILSQAATSYDLTEYRLNSLPHNVQLIHATNPRI